MKKVLILISCIFYSSCAHAPMTCDMYCVSRGGQCEKIEQGKEVYNTSTGSSEREPTRFVCRYSW